MPVDLSMIGLEGQKAYDEHKFTQAQTELTRINAIAKQQELEDAQRNAELDQQVGAMMRSIKRGEATGTTGSDELDDSVESRADAYRRGAEMMFAGGAIDRGMKMIKAADEIQAAENDLLNGQVNRESKKLESQLQTADLMYRYIGTAKNQSEYNAGLKYILNSSAFSDDEKALIQQLPQTFDPEVTRFLADKAISAKDAANIQIAQQGRDLQAQGQAQTQAYRMSLLAQNEAFKREDIRQKELDRKSGKSASAPDTNELKSVEAAVISQVFNGEAPGEDNAAFNAGTQAIASRAKQMVKDNPALDWNVAVARSILESKANGDWKAVRNYRDFGLFRVDGSTETKFDQKGLTPDKAIPAPMKGGKINTNPNLYTKGMYYITPKGRLKYLGDGQWEAPAE